MNRKRDNQKLTQSGFLEYEKKRISVTQKKTPNTTMDKIVLQ